MNPNHFVFRNEPLSRHVDIPEKAARVPAAGSWVKIDNIRTNREFVVLCASPAVAGNAAFNRDGITIVQLIFAVDERQFSFQRDFREAIHASDIHHREFYIQMLNEFKIDCAE